MRIEVIIGNNDPLVYPIKSPKITLGTSETCDITLYADGISRKHVTILAEGDSFYVIDQGSTNGSYINEERLIPGRKTEFTSFFPLRLGDNVLITLLSDDEHVTGSIELPVSIKEKTAASDREDRSSRTTVISLSELNKKTEKLVQNKIQRKAARKAPPQKPKENANKNSIFVPALALMILLSAIIHNLYFTEPEVTKEPLAEEKPVAQKRVIAQPQVTELIPAKDLPPKENYATLLNDIKCTTDTEKKLCDYFPGAREGKFGVIQVGLTLHILIDGSKYYTRAMKYVIKPQDSSDAEKLKEYESLLSETAAYLYFIELVNLNSFKRFVPAQSTAETNPDVNANVPATNEKIDFSTYKDFNLYFALFRKNEDDSVEIGSVIAIKPELMPKLKEFIIAERLLQVKNLGGNAFLPVRSKYVVY